MKKLPLILLFVLIPSLTWAVRADGSPFLICDPQADVTEYRVTGAEWVPQAVPAEADGSIKMDISAAPVGQSNLFFQACNVDQIWGVQCSISVPFGFSRPGSPSTPTNIRLLK